MLGLILSGLFGILNFSTPVLAQEATAVSGEAATLATDGNAVAPTPDGNAVAPISDGNAVALITDGKKLAPSPDRLGGENRLLVFLSTDKPIYRPGETVYTRLVVLQADNYFPLRGNAGQIDHQGYSSLAGLEITGPRQDKLFTALSEVEESSAGFSWTIPAGTAGGRYQAKASVGGSPEAVRPFEIRVYNPPRLKTQIEFLREGYGPGDTVSAVLSVSRAEGGIPAAATVTAVARVDGAEVARLEGLSLEVTKAAVGPGASNTTGAAGKTTGPEGGVAEEPKGICRVSFDLPAEIERGEGTLAFIIEDGGLTETASKTIPILLQTLDLAFYPEGGELVADLTNRVYVQALRPDGKPADISGQIVRLDNEDLTQLNATGIVKTDTANRVLMPWHLPVAAIKTTHEGRGSFEFTPAKGERYALRLLEPSGINRLFPLPETCPADTILRAEKASYPFGEPVAFSIDSTASTGVTGEAGGNQAALITLHHREKLIAQAELAPGSRQIVSLDSGEAEGVLMATVWDNAGRPLAERLIFREPRFKVRINITSEPLQSVPGGKVRLQLESLDENGRPVEAVIGLTVTDDAVLEMVESRDQAPSLPVMVYLENEVKDLADAKVYFDPANPNAGRDIDLLLGTQGWRRFVLVRLDEALKADPEAVRRALAIRSPRMLGGVPQPLPGIQLRQFQARNRAEAELFVEENAIVMNAAPDAVPMLAAPAPDLQEGAAVLGVPDLAEKEQFDQAGAGEIALELDEQAWQIGQEAAQNDIQAEPGIAEGPFAAKRVPGQVALDQVQRMMAEPLPYIAIREYAHQNRPNRRAGERTDFAETVYWNAGLRTNPRDGKAVVEFDLSDSVTSFKVKADAYGYNGALGAADAVIVSLEPFHVEPKLPPLLVSGDRPLIPLVFVNATADPLDKPGLVLRSETLKASIQTASGQAGQSYLPVLPAQLAPDSRTRVLLELETNPVGPHTLSMSAAASPYTDTVIRKLEVLPRGFPVQLTASGLVGPGKPFGRAFVIADAIEPGSLAANVKVYPSPLANLEEALNALLRQPYGCFEQTSSTSYPLVMAQQYFIGHSGVSPDKIKQAATLLDESYAKLIAFESPQKGYEWFGGDPGHEALTAYGLMQFNEMKQVMPVDQEMLDRTRAWLLARRDGQGGFERNSQALDSFGQAPAPLTNLYIIWSLLESGEKPSSLTAEIAAAKKLTAESKDPYLLGLGANILYLAGDLPAARIAASALQQAQDKDGSLGGAETSITRSRGDSLLIETASLAVIAWLRCGDEYAAVVESSMTWLFERCKAGKFGSTQSTILALKAINAYDAARSKPKAPGSLQLMVDGKPFGGPVNFDENSQGALVLPDFSAALSPGEHRIELSMQGGGDMPFALEILYNTPQPASSPECPLLLETTLSTREIKEGEPVDLQVSLKARASVTGKDEDVTMPLAIIGLPAGLEPRFERLKELVSAGQIDSYEIRGRELILYWRGLKAGAEARLNIPLIAEIPGFYTAPASRAYAYYFDEHKHWVAGESVNIKAN
jgi:hypothetical protein